MLDHLSWKSGAKIFVKTTLRVQALRSETSTILCIYLYNAIVRPDSIIVVNCGMYLVKENLNDCKSSIAKLFKLLPTRAMIIT